MHGGVSMGLCGALSWTKLRLNTISSYKAHTQHKHFIVKDLTAPLQLEMDESYTLLVPVQGNSVEITAQVSEWESE
jgi:hypothetical protein